MNNHRVAIIGAGRVGGAIGHLLHRAGYTIASVVTRSAGSAEMAAAFIGAGVPMTDAAKAVGTAGIIFITTPDRSIKAVCEQIAPHIVSGALVMHTSGAHTLDLLDAVITHGAVRAVVHPLQSLPSMAQGARMLPGSYFRIEADPAARESAQRIVAALGGNELRLPHWTADKESAALYHAGAVVASNYLVALIDYGLKFYEALGADKKEALKAVFPLIRGTLNNVEALGTTDALTGPIARGDVATIQGHLDAMALRTPELLALYKTMALQTIAIAEEKGSIGQQTSEEMARLVT